MKSARICKKKNKFQSVNVEIAVMTAIVFVVLFVFVIAVYWISGLFQNHTKPPENSQGSIPIRQVSNSFTIKTDDDMITRTSYNTYKNLGEFRLTAYCPCEKCCEEWALKRPLDDKGKPIVYTASGKIAKAGYTVAADPNVLPYGTKIKINGHEYEVQDCGGAVTGKSIDIYFDTHDEAENFGVKFVEVFVKH